MNHYRVTYKNEDNVTKQSVQLAATPEAAESQVREALGFDVKVLETRKVKG
jgi:hypothetical protein